MVSILFYILDSVILLIVARRRRPWEPSCVQSLSYVVGHFLKQRIRPYLTVGHVWRR